MADMLASALVQEAVSTGVSFLLGNREKKGSEGHSLDRLEMAVSELELALERSAKLSITDISLLGRRKIIKLAYVEAVELLDKHKQLAVPTGHEQGDSKQKQWVICMKPFAVLSTDDVRRFEWYADHANKFVRDVESGCSLHHYNFCNPIVRHLLEGKTMRYYMEQENQVRNFCIWPMYSDERGMEAVLGYYYGDSKKADEKSFFLVLFLRLSLSMDIVSVAIKSMQLLTSQFKHAAESAMGELTLLPDLQNSADQGLDVPPLFEFQELLTKHTQHCRPDPACCKESRLGISADKNSSVLSELQHIFPEQVIYFGFHCYISELKPRSYNRSSDSDEAGRRVSRAWTAPLELTVCVLPHDASETKQDRHALEIIGDDVRKRRYASIQQVAEMLKSDAIGCFERQPELTDYRINWNSKHGGAWFKVSRI